MIGLTKRCLVAGTYDLLIAQDFDRVHLSSAASWNVSRDYGDGCKQDRDAQVRDRVSRGDAEEQTGHQAREDQSRNQSGDNADSCQQNPLFEDQSKDVCWSRSECHAETKFFRATRNRIGNYAVNSDRGDDQRNARKQTEQQSEKSRTRLRGRKNVFHEANVGNGNGRIDGLHFLAHGAGQRDCVTVGAQDDKGIIVTAAVLLRVRQIEFGAGWPVDAGILHVLNHADDGTHRPIHIRLDAAADGALVSIKSAGQRLINDDHIGRAGSVAGIEEATVHQADTQRLKIILADHLIVVDVFDGAAFTANKAFDVGVIHVGRPQRRQSRDNGGRTHAWEVAHAVFQAAPETIDHFIFWISALRKSQTHGDNIFGIQANVDFLQLPEAANHQSTSHQENESKGKLAGHQSAAESLRGGSARRGANRLLQRILHSLQGQRNDRRQAEKNPGEQAGGNGERQHADVDSDFRGARNSTRIGELNYANSQIG